jgi:hypothetical protein
MKIDEIMDIEILRNLAKENRVKVKKDVYLDDNTYLFKEGEYYCFEQDQNYVALFPEEESCSVLGLTYDEVKIYLESR